jgi:hypothetical protein
MTTKSFKLPDAPDEKGQNSMVSIDKQNVDSLRFRFENEPFSRLWPVLHKSGWNYCSLDGSYRYDDSSYCTSDTSPLIFPSALAVKKFLDHGIVSDLYSTLHISRCRSQLLPSTSIDLQQRIRHQIWTLYRKPCLPSIHDGVDGVAASISESTADMPSSFHKTTTLDSITLNISSNSSQSKPSSTSSVLEPGAEIYMHKRGQGKRPRALAKNSYVAVDETFLDSNQENNTNPFILPSVLETQAYMSQLCAAQDERIVEQFRSQYSSWRFLLASGMSILFYGGGCKRAVMHDFVRHELDHEGCCVEIDAVNPDVSMSSVLDLLIHLFLGGQEPADTRASTPVKHFPLGVTDFLGSPHGISLSSSMQSNIVARARRVATALVSRATDPSLVGTECNVPIFLLWHSLDSNRAMRKSAGRWQEECDALTTLILHGTVASTGMPVVRLIVSIDHVDACALLWTQKQLAAFRWSWQQISTGIPNIQEWNTFPDAVRRTVQVRKRAHRRTERALAILDRLAPRVAEVLSILAHMHLERREEWIEFRTYLATCKSKFAVHNDSQFRAVLTELRDHGFVVFGKPSGVAGGKGAVTKEMIQIPFQQEKLKEIIACYEEQAQKRLLG